MTIPNSPPSHATILPLGAIIQKFKTPSGLNIVLNFPTPSLYQKYNEPYFGETIGRVANRISNAKINDLNGRTYQLVANNGPNCLHGGSVGWGKKVWNGPTEIEGGKEFRYISQDGEEGFPGRVEARVRYFERREVERDGSVVNVLEFEYQAELVGGEGVEETVVGMTNHSYFNLSGEETIEGTRVTLSTNQHLPVDDTSIPTGSVEAYPGIDPLTEFVLGPKDPDIDHCFIMDPYTEEPEDIPTDTRNRPLRIHGSFYHPKSKTHLEVLSTEPAFQFYTGKFIDVPEIKGDNGEVVSPKRIARAAFCVEPSRYVNAVNTPKWNNMVLLKRGQKFGSKIVYRTWNS